MGTIRSRKVPWQANGRTSITRSRIWRGPTPFHTGAAAAETLSLDTDHTEIGFAAKHFGVANLGGWFKETSGTLTYDADNITDSSVEITIETGSLIGTSDQRRDALISEFFLDTARYPQITFVSKELKSADSGLTVVGDLTIREVTKEVAFPLAVTGPLADPWGQPRMGVEGTLTVNRRDYGILFDKKTEAGVPFVGDEVTITITAEFAKAAPVD